MTISKPKLCDFVWRQGDKTRSAWKKNSKMLGKNTQKTHHMVHN